MKRDRAEHALRAGDDAAARVRAHTTLEGYPRGGRLTSEDLLELDVDLLVPAALESVITSRNAGRVGAKAVCEGAASVHRLRGLHA